MKINKIFTIILYGRVLVWLGNYYVTKLKENEGKFCDKQLIDVKKLHKADK